MARGAPVNRGAATFAGRRHRIVARDMRRHLHPVQIGCKRLGVVAFVGAECEASRRAGRMPVDHIDRRFALSRAACSAKMRLNNQARAVLHQGMAHETELSFLASSLLEELGGRFGHRRMRVVLAGLSVKVGFAIAAWLGRLVGTILSPPRLHGSPRFDQGAIDGEMLVRREPLYLFVARALGPDVVSGSHDAENEIGANALPLVDEDASSTALSSNKSFAG